MNSLKFIRVFLICCFAYFLAGQVANAASFNCENSQSAIEKMICSDPSLSADDSDLAKVFDLLKTHIADETSIMTDQQNWLEVVRDKCETVECLKEAYKARTAYLSRLNTRIKSPGDSSQKCDVGAPKYTKAGCSVDMAVCVVNSNKSIFQGISGYCGNWDTNVNVYLYPQKKSSAILVGTINEKETPSFVGIYWGEPDRNGFAELEVLLGCGNRNCRAAYYRFDPSQQLMYKYHEGSMAGMSGKPTYFDGYLLDSWLGSQGQYGYEVFKVNQVDARDIVDKNSFSIDYYFAQTEAAPFTCGFYKHYDNGRKRKIKPPNEKWYKYCSAKGVPGKGY